MVIPETKEIANAAMQSITKPSKTKVQSGGFASLNKKSYFCLLNVMIVFMSPLTLSAITE